MLQNLKKISICMILSAICFCPTTIFASQVPKTVRVGLEYRYKNVSSVPISNTSIVLGHSEQEQYFIDAQLKSEKGFTIQSANQYFVEIPKVYSFYQDAVEATSFYENAIPVINHLGNWSIYLTGYSSYQEAENAAITVGEEASAMKNSFSCMELYGDNALLLVIGEGTTPQFKTSDDKEMIRLGDRSYRGVIEVGKYHNNTITAINVIDFNEYLYGVVPSEMPPSYELEALKAQAVAARTYAINNINMGLHKDSGYELCDGVTCQVYQGYDSEMPSTNLAVDSTEGILALYEERPINAVFFASSGGYTENSENVWLEAAEYLKAVSDEKEADTNVWTRTFSLSDLDSLLTANNVSIGKAQNMRITKTSPSGRVQELEIVGSNGSKLLKKEEIRTFFSGKGGILASRMFTINGTSSGTIVTNNGTSLPSSANIKPQTTKKNTASTVFIEGIGEIELIQEDDSYVIGESPSPYRRVKENQSQIQYYNNSNTDTTGQFVLNGKGNGHGVGMSQKGAQGMAQQGYMYDEILKHYYTGITVE